MTALGWIFLLSSTAFVWGLCGWCFYRVLTLPPQEQDVPEPVKEFHSA
jgi:hypothetical protein